MPAMQTKKKKLTLLVLQLLMQIQEKVLLYKPMVHKFVYTLVEEQILSSFLNQDYTEKDEEDE